MAQLDSPGVSVQVIDESFYTPAGPGTVPLIFVASAQDKQNAAGTGTAAGTTQAKAGTVYLLTSQKELADTFGTPIFKTDAQNNPLHAGELNEYGLQAAYSYLGVSNRAYVVRADVNLNQLTGSTLEPVGYPDDGTLWFDTQSSKFGIFEWNANSVVSGGQVFSNKLPSLITDSAKVDSGTGAPLSSFGKLQDYAIVATTNLVTLWYKKPTTSSAAGTWVPVGSEEWKASWPAAKGTVARTSINLVSGDSLSITVEGNATPYTFSGFTSDTENNFNLLATEITTDCGADGVTAKVINGYLEIYSNGPTVTLAGNSFYKIFGYNDSNDDPITECDFLAPQLTISKHTEVPQYKKTYYSSSALIYGVPTGSIWIKTTSPNLGANWAVNRFNNNTLTWQAKPAPLYENNAEALYGLDKSGGGSNLAASTLYVKYNNDEGTPTIADFKIYARNGGGPLSIESIDLSSLTAQTYIFEISETTKSSNVYTDPVTVSFTVGGGLTAIADAIEQFISNLSAALPTTTNIVAVKSGTDAAPTITITHLLGGDIKFIDGSHTPIETMFEGQTNVYEDPAFNTGTGHYLASWWTSTVNGNSFVTASPNAVTAIPEDGRLWYDTNTDEVDILINTGTKWVGYQHVDSPYYTTVPGLKTDPKGPIISSTKPKLQTDSTPLVSGDLWVDTSDTENYPTLYRWDADLQKWLLVDVTDQTTENGIAFHDARWALEGQSGDKASIVDLLTSSYVDPDVLDPLLYPSGMLLWNTRRSGFNVKEFVQNYIDTTKRNTFYGPGAEGELMTDYYLHRWVTKAANQQNGSGTFGRKAQRAVVVQALQALINSNQQIRDEESRVFNLIACPGYPELIGEMVSLNYDRGITAFVIGDSPARLESSATSLTNWGNNVNLAVQDGDDGLVTFDEYLGVFYPWGFTSDNLGNDVVVPPSHMMLRTISLSDNVSYPWFAPAGTRRGGVTNATSVGYINAEGEFVSVALNTGERDTLASIKVNPVTYISGAGLVNYGQYTRARNASALDRINVARLVVYLRRRFTQLAKPYVFEPNDKITRDEIKGAAENLLLELVGQRALYDYIAVCDESNNTPARIDRNELYLDVAIEPVKSVEFIYIPLRLKNTGEIQGLAGQ